MAFNPAHFNPAHFHTAIVLLKLAIGIPIKYIWVYAQVKRNGEVIYYATSYTPFRTERAIQL